MLNHLFKENAMNGLKTSQASSSVSPLAFRTVNVLFEEQVQKHPDAIAAIYNNTKLTYDELDRKSNQIARYLQEAGVDNGTLVGLSLSNSINIIPAIWGILKAGGVYLPLEPSYPQDRIAYMIEDAKPSILLTESQQMAKFKNFSGKIVQLDQSWEEISIRDDSTIERSIEPDQLAYVIYTSGSTGQPKGIMVEHGSFAHGAIAHREYYPEKLKGLLTGAISFDVTLLIIFHLLLSGGTVVIPSSEIVVDVDKIVDQIQVNAIEYILCVPSLYSMILNKSRALPSLKIVSLAGEPISKSITTMHPIFTPNAILYNEYGPTEYAIGTTIAKIYDPDKKRIFPMSVGKPLPDTQVYIFNENLQSLPKGFKGEIFIGGKGIARGYLNKPNLTADNFLSFGSGVLYRTGDFGRFLPDGNLEFLGRMDNQVKIRGNRVELGEIEHALCKCPGLDESVVIVREEQSGNKHLIAYFTTVDKVDIKGELKGYLKKLLPKYMIPSSFVYLESFPRTPNGKIDRNALPNLLEKETKVSEEPHNALENTLSSIWKEILNLDLVGTEDSFFEIGGDSLGLAEMQTLIETRLGINVPVIKLLEYPTIAQLSQYINQQSGRKIVSFCSDLANKKKMAFERFRMRARR